MEVQTPSPKKGESLIGIAGRERAGRITANGRITGLRAWYKTVQQEYAN